MAFWLKSVSFCCSAGGFSEAVLALKNNFSLNFVDLRPIEFLDLLFMAYA